MGEVVKFEKLIRKARAIAPNIDERSKSRHISFLLKRNKIISYGWNQPWKSHSIAKLSGARFAAIHAELSTLIRSNLRFNEVHGLTMVNVRFLKDGTIGISKPCSICQKMLNGFGITDIYYTIEGGEFAQMQ